MSKLRFTPEQRQVIEARNCTTLVSAAAGSGKTAVLVQRIIEKLTNPDTPQDINRLLVVTYTNAAAAEMRERIGLRLAECLATEEYAGNTHLQKQVLLLRNASITTIHSFCLGLVREFFYELDLDPGFRIAEEAELTLLRADVMEELLEERYEKGEEAFLRLTECIGSGKTDDGLVKHIENFYKFAQSAPFPESWLKNAEKLLEEQKHADTLSEDSPCIMLLTERVKTLLTDCEEMRKKAVAVCEGKEGPAPYLEALDADGELLTTLMSKNTYRELWDGFAGLSFQRLSGKKSDATEEKKELVKTLRSTYKEILGKVKKDYFFATPEQMAEDMAAMAPLLQVLVDLCAEYGERYAKKKTERGLVDFSDLEHLAVRLLVEETEDGFRPTETARLLRNRYDEIMIDECQDSNEIQDLLLWSISGEEDGRPNRFMVGDVKQSIYKFRMAKPELFMEKYEKFQDYKEGEDYCKIVLGKNFRSRRAVVDAVNDVFSGIMQKRFGGIEYDDAAKLYLGASYPWDEDASEQGEAYTAELLLTELSGGEEEGEGNDRIAKEAMTVGARIRSLINSGLPVYDGEETGEDGEKRPKFHPVEYKDITVLFRALSGYAEPFTEVFTELGIPAVVEKQSGYFSAQEVAVVLNALRIIDNPLQDIPLVSVLRSEMVGMTEEELALVRIVAKTEEKEYRCSFYEAIHRFSETVNEDWDSARLLDDGSREQEDVVREAVRKLLRFTSHLKELKALSVYAGVPEVLERLYELTDYPAFVRVKPGGERRFENLAMLTEKAKKFEESSYSGIFDFVRYIERLIKYDTDTGEAQIVSGENAVRLMSIHKSKGLEAPVVIVAGLSKQFNRMDVHAGLVLHPEYGVAMDFRDEVLRVKAPTLFKKVIAGQLNYEMLSEELRILYVALTRAKEKLILSATVKSEGDFFAELGKNTVGAGAASYSELLGANSYLDFLKLPLAYCLERGSIRYTGRERSEAQVEEAVLKKEAEYAVRKERYQQLLASEIDKIYDKSLAEELAAREVYQYPYPLCKGKTKLSVSELKKAAYADEEQEELFPEVLPEKTVPRFMQGVKEDGVSGSERGTLYHRIMECLDFCKEYKVEADVLSEMEALIAKGRIRKDAVQLVAPRKLLQFFRSELGCRMQAAARQGTLKKEQPFVIGLPYGDVYKSEEAAADELVMVQGIIDACFEEDGELVLVDYKTDSVRENVKEELTKRYRTQLMYYEQALCQMTGKHVKERMIYAFTNGEAFFVE
ncbi:MAG: helicase-exonuclease AddAB subunit AddA [Lachnospiraceae bacterium]|nr:helicase-exonuclease AddAB subunit AddA [Lachnospiraceae bacterium]MBQ8548696.1 helicase-exonuclease AddAB subunit AddA [Lachnospiraceae bacterium]